VAFELHLIVAAGQNQQWQTAMALLKIFAVAPKQIQIIAEIP
jgi:hypothetical protein